MNAIITFFPVGNGDMTLIQLESGRTILIDINIRAVSDDVRDVLADLRARLRKDGSGRHYVDAMLLTHPDQDHCRGLKEHFHLGPLSEYAEPDKGEDGKFIIREMWSSPMVFRRKPKDEIYSDDALAWCSEARRRANLFKKNKFAVTGDRIQVMGEDEDGKTGDLKDVLVKAGEKITKINGDADSTFEGFLIAPKGKGDATEEERRSKNHSSVIIRFSIANGSVPGAVKYLAGGDAFVEIWERVWADHKNKRSNLEYHILGSPHHCSWRSLSSESWSVEAEASDDARRALGQALDGAFIVASSKQVIDNDDDPPCIGAKWEYEEILNEVDGTFVNTAKHTLNGEAYPMEFEVLATGLVLHKAGSELGVEAAKAKLAAATVLGKQQDREPVIKQGERRFA